VGVEVGGLQDGENLVIEAPQVLAAFIITGFGESVQSIGSQDLAKRGTSRTGSINRLNGELSSTFVNVAEENASSEDLEHAATLDPSSLESMMHLRRR